MVAAQTVPAKAPASPPPAVQAGEAQPPAPATPDAAAQPVFAPLPLRRFKIIRCSENSDFGNLFGAVLPAGMPFEFALRPEFWANCAHMIAHRGDGKVGAGTGHQIEIHSDDVHFFGRLYTRRAHAVGTNRTSVDVVLLEFTEFGSAPRPAMPITHVVEHRGPILKFCLIRVSDGRVVSQGHETEDDAKLVQRSLTRRDSVA